MCNSRNCRHKKAKSPKFFAFWDGGWNQQAYAGQTPEEALALLRNEVGRDDDLENIKVFEALRAGTAEITIKWDGDDRGEK